MKVFEQINRGYNNTFKPGELTLGVVIPVENYDQGPIPTMENHVKRVKMIDELGFKALWVRDIPINIPSFGDAGQTFDPFTYLAFLAGQTTKIALGISSIALPLHHPLTIAKSASSIDVLSEGRMILGVASGDRPQEYPAMNIDFENRGQLFRDAFDYMRNAQESFPRFTSQHYGGLNGQMDVLPKPTAHKIPLLITGSSRQSLKWNAKNGDGWMSYPRNLYEQKQVISQYRALVEQYGNFDQPFMQPLYIDLMEDNHFKPQPIHLGFRIGIEYLNDYVLKLKEIGVNHLAFNLRFNKANMEETLHRLNEEVIPHFHNDYREAFTS
ncbi:MAG: LLM class oxidoreductase [Bacteroidota bacterium]